MTFLVVGNRYHVLKMENEHNLVKIKYRLTNRSRHLKLGSTGNLSGSLEIFLSTGPGSSQVTFLLEILTPEEINKLKGSINVLTPLFSGIEYTNNFSNLLCIRPNRISDGVVIREHY